MTVVTCFYHVDLLQFFDLEKGEFVQEVKEPDPPMYDESSDVAILTDENFENVVLKEGLPWVVEFYAPWCGE